MTILRTEMNRRQYLAATGATVVAAGMGGIVPAMANTTVRQGYQTNMWGMPTYYLMKSGLLEKRGLKIQEFAVPSGNLTMQQMVARQVDLGTYAGPSFILGHDKGDLVGIAVIQNVGKTAQVMARKDTGITKVEQLRGKKVANQTGSSTGNIFMDQIAPGAGLKKGDFEEVRMNTNDMVAAMADRVLVMEAGRIVEIGPARQIIENPVSATGKALVSAVPRLQIPGQETLGSRLPER